MEITEEELKIIMKETILETLTTLGVDTKDPIQMQADFQHLREWRLTTDSLRAKGWLTIIGLGVAGLCGLVWMGLKQVLTNGH